MYGLKPYALGLAALSFVAVAILFGLGTGGAATLNNRVLDIFILGTLVLYAAAVATIVRPSFVRHHADAYVTALLETAAEISARNVTTPFRRLPNLTSL